MLPGDVVGSRFQIERVASWGGMGVVYRALDRESGAHVAIKVGLDPRHTARFAAEAKFLAGMSHPGIVGHVAHGHSEAGDFYVAMEWLEGEDLAQRIRRGTLTIEETVALGVHIARAIGYAHEVGVVHRDIKPGNIFLVAGSVENIKLLDFGVARDNVGERMTAAGTTLGTHGYMAPEQARGVEDIDARADVFSLGCVLYECLTGWPPFVGSDTLALLAKILVDEPPRVSALRAEVPAELDVLLASMLAKDPDRRPANGSAVARGLDELGTAPPLPTPAPATAVLGDSEQRLLAVILIGPATTESQLAPTDATVVDTTAPRVRGTITDLVGRFGGELSPMVGGSMVITLSGGAAATDQAGQAARCALEIRALHPDIMLALALGRGEVSSRWPVGEAIDRAAHVFRNQLPGAGIPVNDVAAGLLEGGFEVDRQDSGFVLRGEREHPTGTRVSAGRAASYLGRDRELSVITSLWVQCTSELEPCALLVTGASGIGKSRLAHEVATRLGARGEPFEVWDCAGDPMRATSPFALIGSAIRRLAGVTADDPIALQREKLAARIRRHVPRAEAGRISEFLGELAGIAMADAPSVQLAAARRNPAQMGDQRQRAFDDLLAAETAAAPVLFVLDNLQWADGASMKMIDLALKHAPEARALVLGLARPDHEDHAPGLWAHRIALGELSRKVCARLLRGLLGVEVTSEAIDVLAERSAGNPFYLEELARAVDEGKGGELPGTVLAMVQARLGRVSHDARRVLRAASVFGQVFHRRGVLALLGDHGPMTGIDTSRASDLLGMLVERDIVVPRAESSVAGESEFAFRHTVFQESAYAMLTPADRALGHRLAGEWLERSGQLQPVVLAEHFEHAGDPARARRYHQQAGEDALLASEFHAALARFERALASEPIGEERGVLLVRKAEALQYVGDFRTPEIAIQAMELLPIASQDWCRAALVLVIMASQKTDSATVLELAQRVDSLEWQREEVASIVLLASRLASLLLHAAHTELADRLLARIDALDPELLATHPAVLASVYRARANRAAFVGDPYAYLLHYCAGVQCLEAAGDRIYLVYTRARVANAFMALGAWREAEAELVSLVAYASSLTPHGAAIARHTLGMLRGLLGEFGEAEAIEREAIAFFTANTDRRQEIISRAYLSRILVLAGDPAAAATEAVLAVDAAHEGQYRAFALAALADARLALADAPAALTASSEAIALMAELGGAEEGEALARIVHAEALAAAGRADEAQAARRAARTRLLERAGWIVDPALRDSFLTQIPEHRRTLA